jgi:mannose-6-phosphate isomerase-like protein (cupin superfamily)
MIRQHHMSPYVLAPGEVRRHAEVWPGIKADSSDTAGLLSVFEDVVRPGYVGPPLHLHTLEDEAMFVVSGSLLVQLGDDQCELPAGSFVWIPRGTPHAYANPSGVPTRVLSLAVPGGIEGLFAEQGRYLAHLRGAPDLAELGRMGARYGGRVLGPPIGPAPPA